MNPLPRTGKGGELGTSRDLECESTARSSTNKGAQRRVKEARDQPTATAAIRIRDKAHCPGMGVTSERGTRGTPIRIRDEVHCPGMGVTSERGTRGGAGDLALA